jgi:hypothetical protein
MRSGFRAASLVMAIVAVFTLAAPVAAASKWTTFKQAGTNAFAFNEACVDNPDGTVTCDGQSIDVFEGRILEPGQPTFRGEQVCYSEHHDTLHPGTGASIESSSSFGCTRGSNSLTSRRLASITLAPTVIELTEVVCDPTGCMESEGGSITVHGTWTGVGPTIRQSGRFRFDDGTCIQVNADKSKSRQATFEGSIDTLDARLGRGSFTFKTTCPLEP